MKAENVELAGRHVRRNHSTTDTWMGWQQLRQRVIRRCTDGARFRRAKRRRRSTSPQRWHGEMKEAQCLLRRCACKMAWSSAPRAFGTWSAGLGRRDTGCTGAATRRLRDRLDLAGAVGHSNTSQHRSKILDAGPRLRGLGGLAGCLHTDVRNQRSRAAIERIRGQLEASCEHTGWRLTLFRAIRRVIPSWLPNGRR